MSCRAGIEQNARVSSMNPDVLAKPAVSVTAEPVPLGAQRARELEAAVVEALSNVTQHAGTEARAWILLENEGGQMTITVRDNGVGMTKEQVDRALCGDRMGIQDSILGRIAEIGGQAVARSQPGRGVEWEFRIPLEEVWWWHGAG